MRKQPAKGRVLGFCLFVLLFLSFAAELYAQFPVVSGSWTAINPLPVSLRGYSITLLQSSGELLLTGGVSFAGGNGFPNFANSAFIYNPLSHSFRPTAHPMNVARAGHTATPLPDETVLITGGSTPQGVTSSAELYDPLADSFTTVGPMSVARADHSATLVDSIRIIDKDGLPNWAPTPLRVLIAGGTDAGNNALDSLEYYDFYTRAFHALPEKLKTARSAHTATWLPSVDLILIAGGTGSASGLTVATAEIFNPAIEKIQNTVSMISPRVSHTATLLKDGSVLLAGGFNGGTMLDTAEIFNPAVSGGLIGTPGRMAFPQARHAAAVMADGTVLLAGGDAVATQPPAPTASAQIFHPTSHLFSRVPQMLTARTDFQMGIALNTDEVLAAGGASFAGGSEFEVGLSASEIFVPRGPRQPRFIDLIFCEIHAIACQILRQHSPLILSGIVHHAMVVAPFPRTSQQLPRDPKTPVSYDIVISGLADSWDAAVVSEDGMPLGVAAGKLESQVIKLNFKDTKSFEDAEESSLLVFQMTSKATVGKEYPISVKSELTGRADLAPKINPKPGAAKP